MRLFGSFWRFGSQQARAILRPRFFPKPLEGTSTIVTAIGVISKDRRSRRANRASALKAHPHYRSSTNRFLRRSLCRLPRFPHQLLHTPLADEATGEQSELP